MQVWSLPNGSLGSVECIFQFFCVLNRDDFTIQSDLALAMLCLFYTFAQQPSRVESLSAWCKKLKAFQLFFSSFFLRSSEIWTWRRSFLFPSLAWLLAFFSVEPVFYRPIFSFACTLGDVRERKEIKTIMLDFFGR